MIIHDEYDQYSEAWYQAHVGIPTASQFHRIITPARGELSKQARNYAFFLAAEQLLNQSLMPAMEVEWMMRGKALEPEAVKHYEFTHDVHCRTVGFVTTDDGLVGASPDRLVGDVGALEVKCPAPHVHLAYSCDGPGDDYRAQVQGQIWVCELEWVDFYSWHPQMPDHCHRWMRDDAYIAKLAHAIEQFLDMKNGILERCRASGYFERRQEIATPTDLYMEEGGL
jgi:hypothetical protein